MTPSRQKNIKRSIQKYLSYAGEKLRFATSQVTFGGKITLFGVIMCLISLFLPWVTSVDSIAPVGVQRLHSLNAFSNIVGYAGVFIFSVLGVMIFSIFSIQRKQKFHAFTRIHLSGDMVAFWGALFIIIFTLHSFFLIHGLQFFSGNVIYGSGLILCMTGAIITLIGSVMMMQENRKNIKGSYVSEVDAINMRTNDEEKKKNMKLPF